MPSSGLGCGPSVGELKSKPDFLLSIDPPRSGLSPFLCMRSAVAVSQLRGRIKTAVFFKFSNIFQPPWLLGSGKLKCFKLLWTRGYWVAVLDPTASFQSAPRTRTDRLAFSKRLNDVSIYHFRSNFFKDNYMKEYYFKEKVFIIYSSETLPILKRIFIPSTHWKRYIIISNYIFRR